MEDTSQDQCLLFEVERRSELDFKRDELKAQPHRVINSNYENGVLT